MRGIAETKKRRAIFDYYRQRADILCLSETHSTQEHEQMWRNEWGGRIIFSHGTAAARGICILFKKDFYCNITNIKADNAGRYICCEVGEDINNMVTLCGVYGPNKDTPNFYQELLDVLAECSERIIALGDYNLVFDTSLDRYNSVHNNVKALSVLTAGMEKLCLTDIWRDRNTGVKLFSWKKQKPFAASRIDFALVSQGLAAVVNNVTYLQGILTDHRAVYLSIEFSKDKRGPGYWKMNTKLLHNQTCFQQLKGTIQKFLFNQQTLDPIQKWLLLKQTVKETCQKMSRNYAHDQSIVISQLSEKVSDYEDKMPLPQEDMEIYTKTKSDLENAQLERTQQIMFRSKVRWYEDGERSSKYFFNLEKCRYNAKKCDKIMTEQGRELSNKQSILDEQHRYYSDLYSKDKDVKFDISNNFDVKLNESSQSVLNMDLSVRN